jgi:branched-chain amino acid transport system permease protein
MSRRLKSYLVGILVMLALPPAVFYGGGTFWTRILITSTLIAMVTVSLNLLVGYLGAPNLALIGLFGGSAYFAGLMVKRFELGLWLSVLSAAVFSLVIGQIIGYATFKRLRGTYLIMASLAFLFFVGAVAVNWTSVTGGSEGLVAIPSPTVAGHLLGPGQQLAWAYVALPFLLLSLYVVDSVIRSRVGRAFMAIRADEDLAESTGVRVFPYKMLAMGIGCFIAGMGGGLYANYMGQVMPSDVGMTFAILMAVGVRMGGQGTLLGPVVGAVLITVLPEAFRPLTERYYLVFAIIIILVAMLLPNGVVGLANSLYGQVKARRAARASAIPGSTTE